MEAVHKVHVSDICRILKWHRIHYLPTAAVNSRLTKPDEVRLLSNLLKQKLAFAPEGKDTDSLRPWRWQNMIINV